jgi:hypothetical protein
VPEAPFHALERVARTADFKRVSFVRCVLGHLRNVHEDNCGIIITFINIVVHFGVLGNEAGLSALPQFSRSYEHLGSQNTRTRITLEIAPKVFLFSPHQDHFTLTPPLVSGPISFLSVNHSFHSIFQ